MHFSSQLPAFLVILLHSSPASSSPLPPSELEHEHAYYLLERDCATFCGYSSQLCCSAGQVCYTDGNNQAQCSTAAAGHNPTTAAATATSTVVCSDNLGQTACGDICCAAGQTCLTPGQCGGTSAAATATMTTVTATSAGAGSTAASSSTTTTGNQGLDSGSIAGIVIGVVVGIIVLAWMCSPITNKRSEKSSSSSARSSYGRGSRRK